MTLPSKPITNGPGQRDLELAFTARNLGTTARFTIMIAIGEEIRPVVVYLRILNFEFVTCQGPNYKLGGDLLTSVGDRSNLPPHNFVFVKYCTEDRKGLMEFSNG